MEAKQQLRERAWGAIREAGVARFPGVEGRIPNFTGSEEAARRLAASPAWEAAAVVKANPDSPQWPARTLALEEGKVVYMAVPRLREERPFWRLDPERLDVPPRQACSIKGASRLGEPVGLDEMKRIDLVLCGSVAVDRGGARLGKGGGYSDLELGLAVEAGLVGSWTTTATTVHPVQILEEGSIPMTAHDFPVQLVGTPDGVLEIEPRHPMPPGIRWEELDDDRLASIPVLAGMRG